MPRLRRLSGKQVIKILQNFDFEIFSQKGSHVKMLREVEGERQIVVVSVHGSQPIPTGTLASIYRKSCLYIPEDDLRPHFYTD
jgi:predicted RNA binding protein YcfA (HicA-like mRNA interferase family)